MKLKPILQLILSTALLTSLTWGQTTNAQDTPAILGTVVETNRPDTLQPGVQGSINPMSDNKPVLAGQELLDESFPNSMPIFGSNVRLRIGGFVKADFIRDFDYLDDRYEFELGSIAVEGSPERELGGITTFHAKESRVNFELRSKAQWKNGKEFPMQVFVEMDWFFDSPAMRLNTRLRLAYGVIGRLVIGQTWTTSTDLTTVPSTIDFSAGDALYGGRVAAIRWQDRINERFTYAVALEEPAGQIDNPFNLEGAFRPGMPKVAGMIKYKSQNGSSLQLGGDIFSMNWKGPATVPNVSKVGYSVALTSRITFKLTEYQDAFVWGGGYGQGLGHQIITLSWDGKASGAVSNTDLTLSPAWWAMAGFNHYWSKSLNSNISTAWAGTTLADFQLDETMQSAGSFHVNLIWFPYPLISTGIEYMWGTRQNKDGISGNASRVQFMVKFKFH